MIDWQAILPAPVGYWQEQYDRYAPRWRYIKRRRYEGATYKEIGAELGIHPTTVRSTYRTSLYQGPSPVERYLEEPDDLMRLAFYIRRQKRNQRKPTAELA